MISERIQGSRLSAASGRAPKVSVVAPCYNEEETLPAFIERMTAACRAAVGGAFEIILVNDGSKDSTWKIISDVAAAQLRAWSASISPATTATSWR